MANNKLKRELFTNMSRFNGHKIKKIAECLPGALQNVEQNCVKVHFVEPKADHANRRCNQRQKHCRA
jgi:hypothetical protein